MSPKKTQRSPIHKPGVRHAKRLNLPRMNQLTQKMGPVQSQTAFTDSFNATPQEAYGGYSGCTYRGGDTGIVCERNMNRYVPDSNFWTGNWVSNVDVKFPAPVLEVVGENQFLNGGNTDYDGNPCTMQCACSSTNLDCACEQNENNCGWVSVNHDCMGAVPNGKYSSLAACESAQYGGFY